MGLSIVRLMGAVTNAAGTWLIVRMTGSSSSKKLAHRNRVARRDLQLAGDRLRRRLHVNAQDSRRGV